MGDDSLISPTNMPAFTNALDKYFDEKIRKMVGSCRPQDVKTKIPIPKVFKYPFLNVVVRDPIVCSQYRYLTILTDGGINPEITGSFACAINRYPLSVVFDNGDLWRIRSENYNINIERYGTLYFNNLIADCAVGTQLENGYNNLYLILTMEKFDWSQFKRHNPHFCVSVTLDSDELSPYYWAGIDMPIALPPYVMMIPFVPMGYQDLVVHADSVGGAGHTREYGLYHMCCDVITTVSVTELTHQRLPAKHVGWGIANRLRFRIRNTGLGTDAFNISLMYANKSDQGMG